ncbi:MAG: EamA family transporter [Bacteroidetes bacterium CG18_big_fil_WC_8_21_14_2_50_41_14]|nr:MAG: EamA family transporter [Bacteroidetes bacterium CG18_big_fil_WC_8_21_14_2_50_41_14]
MKKQISRSILGHEALLLLTAIIWGLAFVAQRAGMESIGPFVFNGIRFLLGSISLLPVIILLNRNNLPAGKQGNPTALQAKKHKLMWVSGLISGLVLFIASSFQQMGMVFTTAGNAGFITSLYVIMVPLLGLIFGLKVNRYTWIGALLAVIGLYFISVNTGFSIQKGDLLVLASAFFFAIHLLIIGYYSNKTEVLWLAFIQFALTGILSLIVGYFTEVIDINQIKLAAIPLLYGGLMSVGVAYTLQIVGQRKAIPTHAAIILSLEALFAALGGWLILDEMFTSRQITGGILMLAGVVLSQFTFNQAK